MAGNRLLVATELICGEPEWVMGQLALERARGRLVRFSEPTLVEQGNVAVKVWLNAPAPASTANGSTASRTVVRRQRTPVRRQPAPVAPLRHRAAKRGWSTERKLAVFGAVALPASLLLGWLVNQLLSFDLDQAAMTVGAVAVILGVWALIQTVRGHKVTCAGIVTHCAGCKGH